MRRLGLVLVFLGLIGGLVGVFSGFGSFFSWNGRHVIASIPIEGESLTHELHPSAGRRYTLSVEAVFDREGLPRAASNLVAVEARLPLVVRVKDRGGTSLADVTGWLDPNELPNLLHGAAARESMRGPIEELVASRVVQPFLAAGTDPLTIDVRLGEDKLKTARIVERRLVIHDDALPPSIRNAFVGGALGWLVFGGGVLVFVVGWLRRKRARKSGSRNPRTEIV